MPSSSSAHTRSVLGGPKSVCARTSGRSMPMLVMKHPLLPSRHMLNAIKVKRVILLPGIVALLRCVKSQSQAA